MTIWVVRAGRHGESEAAALDGGFVSVGWNEIGDLSQFKSREALAVALSAAYPENKGKTNENHANQLWNLSRNIDAGDTIALPLKGQPAIAFGIVSGQYQYVKDAPEWTKHRVPVDWQGAPVPRTKLDQDLLYSFGSSLTVFRVHRNNAEERIAKLLKRGTPQKQEDAATPEPVEADDGVNLYELSQQQISDYIGRKFKGHRMETLVAAILEAKGFTVSENVEGADDGVDILAGSGPMGFDDPHLCVQVKSSDQPVSREVLDQLQGVMQKFNARHGLLVSWGGFKSTVEREAKRLHFNVRLWNDQRLVEELQAVYDQLPKDLQADIPLKQTWVLMDEE